MKIKRNHLAAYGSKQDGATAVEFGLLLLPFFMLIMGIIEISMYYANGIILEGAALASSRVVRTGQAQQSGDAQAAFEQAMCDEVGVMMNCDEIVYEAVSLGSSFAGSMAATPEYDADGNMVSSGFDSGGADEVILIRLSYRHDFLFPLIGDFMEENDNTNSATHISTIVLRTEPYDF